MNALTFEYAVPPSRELEYRTLNQLLREADVVTLHVPLTEAMCGLIGEPELRLMKRDAILVNTSRGPLVDEHALY